MKQNISSLGEFLSFLENPTSKIARELREEGYEVAGHMGVKVSPKKQPPHDMVGILRKKEPIEKSILGIKYNQNQRADYLGKLWTSNAKKGAIEDKKWVLDIYGQENFLELTGLIERISSPYNIQIDKFVYMDPREEGYFFDEVA